MLEYEDRTHLFQLTTPIFPSFSPTTPHSQSDSPCPYQFWVSYSLQGSRGQGPFHSTHIHHTRRHNKPMHHKPFPNQYSFCLALRANPFPEVTDLICRLPLPTLFYELEAIHLGDLMRLWVRTIEVTLRLNFQGLLILHQSSQQPGTFTKPQSFSQTEFIPRTAIC